MSTYNNLGSAEIWRDKKAILERKYSTSSLDDFINNSQIQSINSKFGNYLSDSFAKIEESQNAINQANIKYDSLLSAVDNAMRLVEQCENGGNVNEDSGNGNYTSTISATSSLESNILAEEPERDVEQIVSTPSSSSISSDVKEAEGTSSAAIIGVVSGGDITSSTLGQESSPSELSVSTESGINIVSNGSPTSSNTFGNQTISEETWNRFSNVEQVNIISKLQEVGYTPMEVKEIISGSISVPKVEVAALSLSLKQEINNHPELRNELVNIYGFDIFDQDDNVDLEKLALVLQIDDKNDNDEYSIIDYLHSKGIDIVNQDEFNFISSKIEQLIVGNDMIKDEIKNIYGFNIFDENKKVMRDKLSLAILMDHQKENDEFDLINYLSKYEEKNNNVNTDTSGLKSNGVNLLGVTTKESASLSNNKQ